MANNIFVTYTPSTTGCHNLCFRLELYTPVVGDPVGPDANYCCTLDPVVITPETVNVPRVNIPLDVDVPPCGPGIITALGSLGPGTYKYSGYVQPCCDPAYPDGPPGVVTPWTEMPIFIVVAP